MECDGIENAYASEANSKSKRTREQSKMEWTNESNGKFEIVSSAKIDVVFPQLTNFDDRIYSNILILSNGF